MRLYISSGTHVGNVEERITDVKDRFEALDVVFAEGSEASLYEQLFAIIYLSPRAPLIALAAGIQVLLILPIVGALASVVSGGAKGRDLNIMREIASHYDVEVCEIDSAHTAQPIYDQPILWGIVNWVPVILFLFAYLSGFQSQTVAVTTLLVGYVLFYAMLYTVNVRREKQMVDSIKSQTEDVETACIVLGETHHAGVGKRFETSDQVNVLNPAPGSPSLLTRFNLYLWDTIDSIRGRK